MTSDQVGGLIRAAIPVVVLVGSQYGLNSVALTATLTAVATAVTMVWSFWTNSQSAMIASVNTADNGVKVVPEATNAATVAGPLKGVGK